jgi:hypothetical protein
MAEEKLPTKVDIFPDTVFASAPDFVFGPVLFIDGVLRYWKFAIADQFAVATSVKDLFDAHPDALKAWLGDVIVKNPNPQPVPPQEIVI